MNICCFSRVNYWHGIYGGMDLHGRLLAEGLVDRGHSVTIISTRHPSGRIEEKFNGVRIIYLPNTVFSSRRKGWAQASTSKFFELHRQRPFDLIWSQSFDAFGLSSFKKNNLPVPIVMVLHGCMQQELKSFISNFSHRRIKENIFAMAGLFLTYLWIQRRMIMCSHKIITVSREAAASFEKIYGNIFHRKCVVVSNGIDPSRYRPDNRERNAIRARYAISDDNLLIMAIGRITREKGFHIALKAISDYYRQDNTKVKFMIVGTGEYLDKLYAMVRSYGLQKCVIFTGHVDNTDTAMYYNGSDIVLNPSLTAEGSSLVLLEAMSCGKPVIASRVGGVKSIVIDGYNGFLVEPGDAKSIFENIKDIAGNQSMAQQMSVAARETVLKDFTVDQMVDRTLAVMEDAWRGK